MSTHIFGLTDQWLRLGLLIVLISLILSGCSKNQPYRVNLMPSPDVYDDAGINPFRTDSGEDKVSTATYYGILYATNREPATGDDKEDYYKNARGEVVRLGRATIRVGGNTDIALENAQKISLLKNRSTNYPLEVSEVQEFGVLDDSFTILTGEKWYEDKYDADEDFADLINAKLEVSNDKDIFIYVHGYKVVFENPLLVASELWHFLGYEGVFIAYSWPSTPKTTAYFSDLETAAVSATQLRILLENLSANTDAEQIHIVSYSAGGRVVLPALHQLAIRHSDKTRDQVQEELRIGNVILVGSDYDRMLFAHELADGIWKVPEALTIYQSSNDKALGMSRWVFKRKRLGQPMNPESVSNSATNFIFEKDELEFVDVTNAEGNETGNGHAYFRKSPWVSSDILMTLMYGLDPDERGLVSEIKGWPVWTFPPDYIDGLKKSIRKANPKLAEAVTETNVGE